MSDRPSDGMRFDELRDEFDWMFEFQSRMAKYIRNDPDVHSLAGYVSKLEEQNAKLRELLLDYDKMLAIAADELAGYQSRGLSMDSVLNALRIRMCELGVEAE